MTRAFLLVAIFLLISIKTPGQCSNPPTITLAGSSGTSCGTKPAIIAGNTFGGSANRVTITTDGSGTVNPRTTNRSPFNITYTPSVADIGSVVTITVITNIPKDPQCTQATATYALSVNMDPPVPFVGTVTQPTCLSATGSVDLSGLPQGTWIITASQGGIETTGSGIMTTISGISHGTYNFTVTDAAGCTSNPTADVVINPQPPNPEAPVIGTITQPTCMVLTGGVGLSGLPSSGTWTITRTPGNVLLTGSGASSTITGLTQGTYTFTVTNSSGCTSVASGNVAISAQPVIPSTPVIGTITAPTCVLSTGSVVLNGLPTVNSWTLTRYPGNVITGGSGASATLSGLPSGTYNYTVTTSTGCISSMSANVIIPAQPPIPPAPLIGAITQPTAELPTGSVILDGLPSSGSWTLTMIPGNVAIPGTGSTKTVSGLAAGTYSFTVTNSTDCTSGSSASFAINGVTGPPVIAITEPLPVCFPSTIDITSPKITEGSTPNLTFTYWLDESGTVPDKTPAASTAGTYYIKGTTADGFSTIKPVVVTIYKIPVPNGGPDQILAQKFQTTMDAKLANDYETGIWSLISGAGELADSTSASTTVTGLSFGKNLFRWTVTNKVCSPASDSVIINVQDLPPALPTLITPNMDGKNDYFVVKKADDKAKMMLVIFDRRGVQVYKNDNYENTWNGVDYNGRQLPDDTYFYVLKINNGKSATGYIVVRR
jgi:gliding motility-associated-like protein